MATYATWGRSLADAEEVGSMPTPPHRQGDAFPGSTFPRAARQLAEDVRGRVGEIMDISREYGRPAKIWLRPVGGGIEWVMWAEDVRILP